MKHVAVNVGLKGQYKLPEAFSREIGRVIVHWAYYENYLTRLTWKLLDITQAQGRLAVREPRTDERLELIADLAALKKLQLNKQLLDSMITRSKLLRTKRDLLAHGGWAHYAPDHSWNVQMTRGNWPKQTPVPNAPKGKRSIAPEFTQMTVDDLRKIVEQVEVLIHDARALAAVIAPDGPPPES